MPRTDRMLTDDEIGTLTVDLANCYAKAGRMTFADARRFAEMWNTVKVSTTATVISVRNAPRIPFPTPFILVD